MTLQEAFDISSAYNHNRAMNDAKEGEKIIRKSEEELRKMKAETSDIKVGDVVTSTGSGTVKEGIKGKVIEKSMNGKFVSFLIDWDYLSKKKNHYKTFERKQDVK